MDKTTPSTFTLSTSLTYGPTSHLLPSFLPSTSSPRDHDSFFPNSHGNEVAAGSAELVGGRPSERAAAAEEEAAHHGDEGDGLDGRDDAPERGVHQERHVPH